MTKNVTITVSGRQFDISEKPIEQTVCGTYYLKNGKHYVLYEELDEESKAVTRNRVKFHDGHFEMVKNGAVSSAMIFEENEDTNSKYTSGAGAVNMEIHTRLVDIIETEELIHSKVRYSLGINGQFISECEVDFKVMAEKN